MHTYPTSVLPAHFLDALPVPLAQAQCSHVCEDFPPPYPNAPPRVQAHAHHRQNYTPRQPEKTVLYGLVTEHMETLFLEAELFSEHGFGYPSYVRREFEGYRVCGQFCGGFARLKCESCGEERRLPFRCKGKAVCPSCVARRMAERAAFLVDEMLPDVPFRQYTFTIPKHLRWMILWDPARFTGMLNQMLRVIFAGCRKQARRKGIKHPLVGSVSFLQRYGSKLEGNPHIHAWLPDGVFYLDAKEVIQFQRLEPPTSDELMKMLSKIRARVLKLCKREVAEPNDDQLALAAAIQQSIEPSAVAWLQSVPTPGMGLCAQIAGFSLHADLSVKAHDRRTLERLLRYGLRNPFSQKRLSLESDGKVKLKLRKPDHLGQTYVRFEPVEFLRRLAAIIPPPRQNQIRFHGIFGPHFKHHTKIKAWVPKPIQPKEAGMTQEKKDNPGALESDESLRGSPYRRLWAELLRRIFQIDGKECPNCRGRLKLISLIQEPTAINKICSHLGLPTQLPPLSPPRAPPQQEFFE